MIISEPLRFVFVHVPRTGGWSMYNALKRYNQPYRATMVHEPLAITVRQRPQILNGWFRFGFVRNPWDRIVSLMASGYNRQRFSTVHRFLDWWEATEHPYPAAIALTARWWLTDVDGALLVDWVGRFEKLHQDWDTAQRLVGVDPVPLPSTHRTKHKPFQEHYQSPSEVDRVGELCSWEVSTFEYSFST